MISGSVTWFLSYNNCDANQRELLFPILRDYILSGETLEILTFLICVIVFLKLAQLAL